MKFNEAFEINEKRVHATLSAGSLNYLQGKKKYTLEFFEGMDTNEITSDTLLDFIIYLKKRNPNMSNKTINKYVNLSKYILREYADNHLYTKKLRERKVIVPCLQRNIIALVFTHYRSLPETDENLRNYLMFKLLLDTGLRISELLSLRLRNFDLNTSSILVTTTKRAKDRYTFFQSDTQLLLNKYIKIAEIDDYIFIDRKTRNPIKVTTVETICTRLKNTLNIDVSISPHKWRHTFATYFLRRTKDIEALRQILGHADIRQTQTYLHLDKNDLRNIYFE